MSVDDPKANDLIDLIKAGKAEEAADILSAVHPAITAVLIVQGTLDHHLSLQDVNTITNLLLERSHAREQGRPPMPQALAAILSYCQADEEWKDFREYLLDNVNSGFRETLRQCTDDKEETSVMEAAAALDERVNHVWAVAHRARLELARHYQA